MPLGNCEVNLILTWLSNWAMTNSSGGGTFAITVTEIYIPVASLSLSGCLIDYSYFRNIMRKR